ncbi:MAG: acyltransferase domain-containing protein [Limnobacter sp.]|uniref:ACP S-malonyltransferase n=1 Tax=Limnobacter sp. TaxID=2003368 RepID=UPI0022BF0071|nr:acyltransferase domain-containing protein [Limnobacter sp.]MCZ8016161.1 acyltransferase domain-containing protein [Limnobacter sp.]
MSLCIMCPGQGSQTTDMLTRLLADPLIVPHLQPLLSALPFDPLAVSQNPAECFANANAQPLIVVAGSAVSQALKSQGIAIGLSAGYSIGELTAHAVAGSLLPLDAVHLAVQRAQHMDKAAPQAHGMMAVKGVRLEQLHDIAQENGLAVAIVNDDQHAVLAGRTAILKSICKNLESEYGAHVVHVNVQVPSHTAWLKAATTAFREALENTIWNTFECPVLSALDGSPVETQAHAVDCLARQISEPLQWARTLDLSSEMGATTYFEVGPGNTLTRMVRERFPNVPARALSEFQTFEGALHWLRSQNP